MSMSGENPSQSPSGAIYTNVPTSVPETGDSYISARHTQHEEHFHSIIAPILAVLLLVIIIALCRCDFSEYLPRKPRNVILYEEEFSATITSEEEEAGRHPVKPSKYTSVSSPQSLTSRVVSMSPFRRKGTLRGHLCSNDRLDIGRLYSGRKSSDVTWEDADDSYSSGWNTSTPPAGPPPTDTRPLPAPTIHSQDTTPDEALQYKYDDIHPMVVSIGSDGGSDDDFEAHSW